jgi:hypothetical protein
MVIAMRQHGACGRRATPARLVHAVPKQGVEGDARGSRNVSHDVGADGRLGERSGGGSNAPWHTIRVWDAWAVQVQRHCEVSRGVPHLVAVRGAGVARACIFVEQEKMTSQSGSESRGMQQHRCRGIRTSQLVGAWEGATQYNWGRGMVVGREGGGAKHWWNTKLGHLTWAV